MKDQEKLLQIEKETETIFSQKKEQTKSGNAIDQLKIWLDNTPFRSQNTQLKRDTLLAIMAAVMKLSSKEMDEFTTTMSDKLILTLSKYLFKAFELIG